jgi:hypothetical protein
VSRADLCFFVFNRVLLFWAPWVKPRLLQQIAAISTMERGKLSAYTFKERSANHRHRRWPTPWAILSAM